MGLLNTHQLLEGARRPGTLKTYVNSLVKERPTPTLTAGGQISLAGGVVEFDGRDWSLDTLALDLDTVAPFLKSNTEYVFAAVPKYDEPMDKVDAETNPDFVGRGVNYYVEQNPLTKEFYASYFIPSAAEAAVAVAGGWDYLQKKAWSVGLDPTEKLAFDDYSEQLNRLGDPRYTGRLMPIRGVEFMLAEVYPQTNESSLDRSLMMTQSEFEYFLASQGFVASRRLDPTAPYTITDAATQAGTFFTDTTATVGLPGIAPGQKMYRLSSVALYESAANAAANINAFPVAGTRPEDLVEAFNFVTGVVPNGLGWANVFAVGYEYYVPTFMPIGQTGYEDGIVQFITKEQARVLGRVNPVYLNDQFSPQRVSLATLARPALMWYADPAELFKFRTGVCTPINVDIDITYNGGASYEVSTEDEIGGP